MKILRYIFRMLIILVISVIILLSFYGYTEYEKIYKQIDNNLIEEKVDEIRNREDYTKLTDIDKKYLDAVIAAEDNRFYSHGAIDQISITRAIIDNFSSKKIVSGGSTITQQFVKNTYLTQEQNLKRKYLEAILSIELEKRYSKDEILELYVNSIFFGQGMFGIKQACKGYFNITPKKMTLNQAAYLAGVPNAPSKYNTKQDYTVAKKRRDIVLEKMVRYNKINSKEAKEVMEKEIGDKFSKK